MGRKEHIALEEELCTGASMGLAELKLKRHTACGLGGVPPPSRYQ